MQKFMGIILALLGCVLLYSKSKYSPVFISRFRKKVSLKNTHIRLLAYTLFFISIVLLTNQLGFWTGLVTFLIVLMFGLSLTIVIVPLNKRVAYILCGLSILMVIIENML